MSAKKKGFKPLVPNKDFVMGTFTLSSFGAKLAGFINLVQQKPVPKIGLVDGLTNSEQNAIKAVNKSMASHFATITKDVGAAQKQVANIQLIIGKIYNVAHHSELAISMIYKLAKAGGDVNNAKVQAYLKFITKALEDLDTEMESYNLDDLHTRLNTDISNLESDIVSIQTAIPDSALAKLPNLTQLTQADAKALLDKQISNLKSEADTLQTEIAWETAGQVAMGIVGGAIFLTNIWDPIGWAAAGATVTGEIELAKDKASKATQLSLDRQAIIIDKEEELILGPYYTIKRFEGVLQNALSGIEKIKSGMTNIETYIDSANMDISGFITDLGDPSSLELDFLAVVGTPEDPGDLLNLAAAAQKLMAFPAGSHTGKEAKFTTMAKQGDWDKALNDPKSPYYIKYVKEAMATGS